MQELPACFRPVFGFRYFNVVQSEAFEQAYCGDRNMVAMCTHATDAATAWLI